MELTSQRVGERARSCVARRSTSEPGRRHVGKRLQPEAECGEVLPDLVVQIARETATLSSLRRGRAAGGAHCAPWRTRPPRDGASRARSRSARQPTRSRRGWRADARPRRRTGDCHDTRAPTARLSRPFDAPGRDETLVDVRDSRRRARGSGDRSARTAAPPPSARPRLRGSRRTASARRSGAGNAPATACHRKLAPSLPCSPIPTTAESARHSSHRGVGHRSAARRPGASARLRASMPSVRASASWSGARAGRRESSPGDEDLVQRADGAGVEWLVRHARIPLSGV